MSECNIPECPLYVHCDLVEKAHECRCWRINQPKRRKRQKNKDRVNIQNARKADIANPITGYVPPFLSAAKDARDEERRLLCRT